MIPALPLAVAFALAAIAALERARKADGRDGDGAVAHVLRLPRLYRHRLNDLPEARYQID
jgi:hypothetical protein